MKHFKSPRAQYGQTFIEIVLAVYMIGSILSAILLLQSSVFSHVTSSIARINQVILLEKYLFDIDLDNRLQKKTPAKKSIEQPPITLSYTTLQPKTESSLHAFKNIEVIRLEASQKQLHAPLQESLIALRYRPKKEAA